MSTEQKMKQLLKTARLQRLAAGGSKAEKALAVAADGLGLDPVAVNPYAGCKPWGAPQPTKQITDFLTERLKTLQSQQYGDIRQPVLEELQKRVGGAQVRDPYLLKQKIEHVLNTSVKKHTLESLKLYKALQELRSAKDADPERVRRLADELVKPFALSEVYLKRQPTRVEYNELNTNMRYEVDLNTLRQNAKALSAEFGGRRLVAYLVTVGMVPSQYLQCARVLSQELGASLIVGDVKTGLEVAAFVPGADIIVDPSTVIEIEPAIEAGFAVLAKSERDLVAANITGKRFGTAARVHLRVNVNGGPGFTTSEAKHLARNIRTRFTNLNAVGVYTVAAGDAADSAIKEEFGPIVAAFKQNDSGVFAHVAAKNVLRTSLSDAVGGVLVGSQLWGLSPVATVTSANVPKPVITIRSRCLPNNRQRPGLSKTKNPPPALPVVVGGAKDGITAVEGRVVLIDGQQFNVQVEETEGFVLPPTTKGVKAPAVKSILPAVWHGRSGDSTVYLSPTELLQIPSHVPRSVFDSALTDAQMDERLGAMITERDTTISGAITKLVADDAAGRIGTVIVSEGQREFSDPERLADDLDNNTAFSFADFTRFRRISVPRFGPQIVQEATNAGQAVAQW